MQARYVILQVLLENTKGLVSIDRITDEKGAPDIIIKLDRQRIELEGRPAIGEFLKKLQVCSCKKKQIREKQTNKQNKTKQQIKA